MRYTLFLFRNLGKFKIFSVCCKSGRKISKEYFFLLLTKMTSDPWSDFLAFTFLSVIYLVVVDVLIVTVAATCPVSFVCGNSISRLIISKWMTQ